jgi:hypothetical protein
MDHFEMVEKLRAKANVSYEDAKAALEAVNWDLLDALVYLEKEGKMNPDAAASYTTKQEPTPRPAPEGETARGMFRRMLEVIAGAINRMNKISLEVHKRGKVVLTLPLTAFALLLIFCFWFIIPLMVVGLFFGMTYRFQGSQAVTGVNKVMDTAAGVAQNIKTGVNNNDNKDKTGTVE